MWFCHLMPIRRHCWCRHSIDNDVWSGVGFMWWYLMHRFCFLFQLIVWRKTSCTGKAIDCSLFCCEPTGSMCVTDLIAFGWPLWLIHLGVPLWDLCSVVMSILHCYIYTCTSLAESVQWDSGVCFSAGRTVIGGTPSARPMPRGCPLCARNYADIVGSLRLRWRFTRRCVYMPGSFFSWWCVFRLAASLSAMDMYLCLVCLVCEVLCCLHEILQCVCVNFVLHVLNIVLCIWNIVYFEWIIVLYAWRIV